MFEEDPDLVADRFAQSLIADKNYYGRDFERSLAGACLSLLCPARKGESPTGRIRVVSAVAPGH